jgi:hypothetical protein
MHIGKKMAVVLSVLATGAGAALFFRKDASPLEGPLESSADNPFGQPVERRVAAGAAWVRKIGAARPGRPWPAQRVAPTATASIAEPGGPLPEGPPAFHKSFNPVGSLLGPIDDTAFDDTRSDESDAIEPPDAFDGFGDAGQRTHRVVDGDTLTTLANHYLGRADRYLEIFELNRDVLTNPDLLPIGAKLKIPPRQSQPAAPPPRGGSPRIEPPRFEPPQAPLEQLPLVPVRSSRRAP